tara:strand:- start:279 stop:806 length:528 start_codon:yes stop_codon:yes gene_type:complete
MGTLNLGGSGASITNSGAHITLGTVPCFSARADGAATSGTKWETKGTSDNNWTPIPFDKCFINRGNCFNTSEFKFVCTVAGVYDFNVSLISGDTDHWFRGFMYHLRGSTYTRIAESQCDYGGSANIDYSHCGFNVMYDCQVGDKVWVTLDNNANTSVYIGSDGLWSQFTGKLISL